MLSPVVSQHAAETPILVFDFLNNDVNVFGLLVQNVNQGLGHLLDHFGLLLSCRATGDLQVDVRHGISQR